MTFTPSINGKISTVNSTSTPLGVAGVFTGTADDVSQYKVIELNIVSNVSSAPLGVNVEFSSNGTDWDFSNRYTFEILNDVYFFKHINIQAKFCRVVYITVSSQTLFRLQTKFHTSSNDTCVKLDSSLHDAFGRLRVSRPYTLLSLTHIGGKKPNDEFEITTGLSSSTADTNGSFLTLATTGTGSTIVQSRRRGYYQPGKSLLWLTTGLLNGGGTNAATVTTKIGCFDDDDGYYFQHITGVNSLVERSSSTGSLVETIINQDSWNIRSMDGTTDVNLNTSKTLIFYANIEWLGVGGVTLGVIINNTYYDVHKFRHSNILTIPYITSASLPLRWEIISTGGVGSMKAICGTVISEGGFNPIGSIFSANMGSSTKAVNNENPLIALRVKSSNSKTLIILKNYTVMSSSGANVIVRVWKFRDVTAASVLTGSSFNSVNTNSVAEYDVSSSAISTTGGQLMFNTYFSNNNDQIPLINSQDTDMSFNNGLSELIVITAETIGGNENLIAGLTWKEIV